MLLITPDGTNVMMNNVATYRLTEVGSVVKLCLTTTAGADIDVIMCTKHDPDVRKLAIQVIYNILLTGTTDKNCELIRITDDIIASSIRSIAARQHCESMFA